MNEKINDPSKTINNDDISPQSKPDLELEDLYMELKEAIDELKNLLNCFYKTQKQEKTHELLTSREVQNYLRISKLTLKRYRERSNIRSVEVSTGKFLYHFDDVRKLTHSEHSN